MKKMLSVVSCSLLCATASIAASQSSVPRLVPSPFLDSTVKIHGGKMIGYGRDVYVDSKRVFRNGDMAVEGTVRDPAQITSEKLSIAAAKLFFSRANGVLFASKELSDAPVDIKGVFVPRSNRNSIRLEVTCERAKLTRSVWTLEGKVSGFYEDSSGRQPLSGELVKLSAFDNAISIVQDGAISLSDDAVR